MKEVLKLDDKIYGQHNITSQLLIDLITSASVQRIKKINQFGVPDEFYHKQNFSRYEHCAGVMLLLKCLDATEEEQAAGLLHDVSHMAFSHVYDWVIEDHTEVGPKKEAAQDNGHYGFIHQSEIPQIVVRHGIDPERITQYHHFTLLEMGSPALCADRVDYALRELSTEQAVEIFRGLTVAHGQIVCKDFETAAIFGRVFLDLQREHWGGYEAVARYTYFSAAIKRALELEVLTQADFLTDDADVTLKLKQSSDGLIQQTLNVLRKKPLVYRNTQGSIFYKKFRFIDPLFLTDNNLALLSRSDNEFKQLVCSAQEENQMGVFVPSIT